MDGFWIYHTASVDHHTNEDLSMIDEGDDCAYVIGNNALHSGQNFLNCLINFALNSYFLSWYLGSKLLGHDENSKS